MTSTWWHVVLSLKARGGNPALSVVSVVLVDQLPPWQGGGQDTGQGVFWTWERRRCGWVSGSRSSSDSCSSWSNCEAVLVGGHHGSPSYSRLAPQLDKQKQVTHENPLILNYSPRSLKLHWEHVMTARTWLERWRGSTEETIDPWKNHWFLITAPHKYHSPRSLNLHWEHVLIVNSLNQSTFV